MEETKPHIAISGILQKITTTLDGGWRISFDVPYSDASQVLDLAGLRNQVVQIVVIPTIEKSESFYG